MKIAAAGLAASLVPVAQDKAFKRIGSLTVELNEAVRAENPP